MIYVTQGHEHGIGLEVFFKTCLLMSRKELSKITLIAFRNSVDATLKSLKIPHSLFQDLNVIWLESITYSQSLTALNAGMKLAEKNGILFTLPTSKDQFDGFAGHTEYFRNYYNKSELGMFFSSPGLQVLLLSDHIPLVKVTQTLTKDVIQSRIRTSVETLIRWKWPIGRILVSGFNPHAGEKGIIGNEDERVTQALKQLRDLPFEMSGPLPGDTMYLEQRHSSDVLVYLYHDQGLGPFKGLQGFIGSNITLGLEYPRFSPDHGTSFSLYGKNQADYRGCAYSLREALSLLENLADGKNSGHKGQSSQSKKHRR